MSTGDFTLKNFYAHHIIDKNQQWQRKAALQTVTTKAINVHIIKIIIHNFPFVLPPPNILAKKPLSENLQFW